MLDLSGVAPAHVFGRAAEVVHGLQAVRDRPGSIDTAVSTLWLSGVADLDGALADVAAALAPGGELVFLDIVGETGIGRVGQRLVSPLLQRTAGWRVDRNLPALIRAAGWNITDLERIPMPRYVWPVHGLVEGRARLRTRTRDGAST